MKVAAAVVMWVGVGVVAVAVAAAVKPFGDDLLPGYLGFGGDVLIILGALFGGMSLTEERPTYE